MFFAQLRMSPFLMFNLTTSEVRRWIFQQIKGKQLIVIPHEEDYVGPCEEHIQNFAWMWTNTNGVPGMNYQVATGSIQSIKCCLGSREIRMCIGDNADSF